MISSNTALGGSSTFGQPRKSGLLSHNPCSIPCRSRGYTRSGILAAFFAMARPTGIFEFHPSDEFFVQRLSVTRGVRQWKPKSLLSNRCTVGPSAAERLGFSSGGGTTTDWRLDL